MVIIALQWIQLQGHVGLKPCLFGPKVGENKVET